MVPNPTPLRTVNSHLFIYLFIYFIFNQSRLVHVRFPALFAGCTFQVLIGCLGAYVLCDWPEWPLRRTTFFEPIKVTNSKMCWNRTPDTFSQTDGVCNIGVSIISRKVEVGLLDSGEYKASPIIGKQILQAKATKLAMHFLRFFRLVGWKLEKTDRVNRSCITSFGKKKERNKRDENAKSTLKLKGRDKQKRTVVQHRCFPVCSRAQNLLRTQSSFQNRAEYRLILSPPG